MKTVVMNRSILTMAIILVCCIVTNAQLERLRIETYYIADADDATDTIGGHLEEGSVTYRIFVDMLPDSRLMAVYGDNRHPLIFSSDHAFFNHREEGITFGKDLSRNRYSTGTAPLDTYITLGQCSKSFAQGAYFGTPKDFDQDGSVVGGVNNDGGSAAIASGLLKNGSTALGLPLTEADGLSLLNVLPNSWIDIGFIDVSSGVDTTIFGSGSETQFSGTNVLLRNSGAKGIDAEQNEVLVAQLTTKGEISFELNLEVEVLKNGVPEVIRYVARNESLGNGEVFHPLLKYPYACGCTDPAYLEASTTFACTDNSKCLTPVILGCMDSLACNFDPDANYNIQDLCCYVGYCNDLDISIVCPDLRLRNAGLENVHLYPNPAADELTLTIDDIRYADIPFTILDLTGSVLLQGLLKGQDRHIDISTLANGYYILQFETSLQRPAIPFVKI